MADSRADTHFKAGHAHHVAGRLADAERDYRSALAVAPNHIDALHFLGVIALQCGNPQAAAELISQSTTQAATFGSMNNLGEALRLLGRFDDALACFNKSVELNPAHADALANAALIHIQRNQSDLAEQKLREALRLNANHLSAVTSLAGLLDRGGKTEESAKLWATSTKLAPGDWRFQLHYGDALMKNDDVHRGVSAFRRAGELAPTRGEIFSKLGLALSLVGKFSEAIDAARRAVELSAGQAQALNDYALVLERAGQMQDAIDQYRKAMVISPSDAMLRGTLGRALASLNRVEEALEQLRSGRVMAPNDYRFSLGESRLLFKLHRYEESLELSREAVRLAPQDPDCHAALAFSLLALKQFEEGFAEYEWRWRSPTFTTKPRDFPRPLWNGSDIAGRSLLVHSEQGFGDIFQFLRYIPMLLDRQINVILEVPYKIAALVRRMSPKLRVVISGTVLPDFDLHLPVLSLPSIFRTTPERLPAAVPYLRADPALAARWDEKITAAIGEEQKLRVGLVWGGSAKPDPLRSTTLNDLEPLLRMDRIAWIALQPDESARQLKERPNDGHILDLTNELRDFSDTTASIFANLDLLITVDTSSAHLAGAMGIKTWILLPYSPDWRWLADPSTSPWYPTARLFKQKSPGDWAGVTAEVMDAIRVWQTTKIKR